MAIITADAAKTKLYSLIDQLKDYHELIMNKTCIMFWRYLKKNSMHLPFAVVFASIGMELHSKKNEGFRFVAVRIGAKN